MKYPLEIENVGSDEYIVMSRGHHDPHEFMRQVRSDGYEWPLGMPTHHWAKAVPTKNPYMRCIYAFVPEGTRGAFPCTYAHEAYHERRYEEIVAAAPQQPASVEGGR